VPGNRRRRERDHGSYEVSVCRAAETGAKCCSANAARAENATSPSAARAEPLATGNVGTFRDQYRSQLASVT